MLSLLQEQCAISKRNDRKSNEFCFLKHSGDSSVLVTAKATYIVLVKKGVIYPKYVVVVTK